MDILERIENLDPFSGSFTAPDKPIVVSFSGGRSSAFMVLMFEMNKHLKGLKKHYVFANTGREVEDTLIFIKYFSRWLDIDLTMIEAVVHFNQRKSSTHKVCTFGELSRNGEPFIEMVKKYGLPNIAFPHCTRELKINPIRSFIRTDLGLGKDSCIQALGMRFDESKRITKHESLIYPLFDFGITKSMVNEFWNHEQVSRYTLNIEEFEGNCDLCFKKSWSKLKLMARKNPASVLWWDDLQEVYSKLNGDNIYRDQKSARDLLRESADDYDNKDISCSCGKGDEASFLFAGEITEEE